jgi:peptide/nickel transport system permease protein
MLKLILSRLLQGVFVLLVISLLVFALLAAAGGDAVSALRDNPQVSEETIAALRRVYGLDRPLMTRYANWLTELARGSLGQSIYFQAPVWSVIWPRLLRTMALAAVAMAIACLISLSLGLAAARRSGSLIDRLCGAIILLAASTPRLVLSLFILALIARTALFGDAMWLLRILPPAFILSFPLIALLLAQTRAAVGAALGEEFARTARAKGLPERAILLRHALRPALNPLITIFGYSLGGLMSGSVIVEKVMGWPGLGQLSVTAVQSRDAPLLLGVVLVASAAVLAGNLVADILLRLNDPRLR